MSAAAVVALLDLETCTVLPTIQHPLQQFVIGAAAGVATKYSIKWFGKYVLSVFGSVYLGYKVLDYFGWINKSKMQQDLITNAALLQHVASQNRQLLSTKSKLLYKNNVPLWTGMTVGAIVL